jgi:hypothetical protein
MVDVNEAKSSAEAPPLAGGQIEIWKKIVDVQQHFNDLELRIRNFALIVTGAFLGLGGYAIKDGGMFSAWGWQVSVAGVVVFVAVFPLLAFYFMDRFWYHRLLEGAVAAGAEAEKALKGLGYSVELGSNISSNSPIPLGRWKMRSKHKMDAFYALLLLPLLALSFCLGFGFRPQPAAATQAAVSTSTDGLPQIPAAPSAAPAGVTASAASQQASTLVPAVPATPAPASAGALPRKAPASAGSAAQAATQQGSTPRR